MGNATLDGTQLDDIDMGSWLPHIDQYDFMTQVPGCIDGLGKFACCALLAGSATFGMPADAEGASPDVSGASSIELPEELSLDASAGYPLFDAAVPGTQLPPRFDDPCFEHVGIPDYVRQHVSTLLSEVAVPEHWLAEGVARPSDECFQCAQLMLESVFERSGQLPVKVVVTRESSLYVLFRNSENDTSLRVEIDDELDIIAALSCKGAVVDSGPFENELVDKFLSVLQAKSRA